MLLALLGTSYRLVGMIIHSLFVLQGCVVHIRILGTLAYTYIIVIRTWTSKRLAINLPYLPYCKEQIMMTYPWEYNSPVAFILLSSIRRSPTPRHSPMSPSYLRHCGQSLAGVLLPIRPIIGFSPSLSQSEKI